MIRKPNLNALRLFDATARLGSFRAAADEVHLTQGAVAQQIRGLEADLGVALFTREARGVSLTDPGASYWGEVARALAILDAAGAALSPRSALVLSVPPSLASKWLVPALPGFAEAHPGIELHIAASEALATLGPGGADLAIRQGKRPDWRGLVVHPLAKMELVAVARPGLAPAGGLADLARHPLIEDGHAHWARLLSAAGQPRPSRPLRFNQTALAIEAAAAGQGIALAPRLLCDRDLAEGRLEGLWSSPAEGGYWLVHAEGREDVPGVRPIVDWLLGLAGR